VKRIILHHISVEIEQILLYNSIKLTDRGLLICQSIGEQKMAYNGRKRKEKAELTRQKIYETADRMFGARSYSQISVNDIIKEAGVSKGAFYFHFASKDALFTSLINDYVVRLDTDYQAFLDTFPDDAPTEHVLRKLVGKIADLITGEIGFDKIKTVYKAALTSDYDTSMVLSYNRGIYTMFSRVLERGIARGEFRTDTQPDVLARHMMIAFRGVTYEWCVRYPDFDYKAQALAHFKLLLEGLQ
jgi:AcrR family transcriptional regulator